MSSLEEISGLVHRIFNFLYRLLQTSPNTITNENQTHLRLIFSGTDGFRGGGGRRRREGAGESGGGRVGHEEAGCFEFRFSSSSTIVALCASKCFCLLVITETL